MLGESLCITIDDRGGLGIKFGLVETENSAQYWDSKIFISFRPEFIQATHIFSRSRRGLPTHHPSQSAIG